VSKHKLLQHDIERELEGLTFDELCCIAMLINEFYSKSNGKPTQIFNLFNYTKESEQ
jgi:hypothetical protein